MDSKKSAKRGKDGKQHEPSIADDLPRVDWSLAPAVVPPETVEEWHKTAWGAVRKGDLDAFKACLKAVPNSALVVLLLHNHDKLEPMDLLKLAIVRGAKLMVDCMIKVLCEPKFFELAVWGDYRCIHVAAMWGQVDILELFHDYYARQGGDPSVRAETVRALAARYNHPQVEEFYKWRELCSNYRRLLENLAKHLEKAGPQKDPVFTEEDIAKYRAGCEEQLDKLSRVRFQEFPLPDLIQAIREAFELRCWAKAFVQKDPVPAKSSTKPKKKK